MVSDEENIDGFEKLTFEIALQIDLSDRADLFIKGRKLGVRSTFFAHQLPHFRRKMRSGC